MLKTLGIVAVSLLLAPVAFGAGLRPDDNMTTKSLGEPTEIEKIPCDKGDVWYYQDGKLAGCRLSRDANVRGADLPAKTWVKFSEKAALASCFLPKETLVDGHRCAGKGEAFVTTFHPNGRLKNCFLGQPEEINGVPCAKDSFWSEGTSFHDNGQLATCKLSKNVTVVGRPFRKGDAVNFDEDGDFVEPK